MRFGRALQIGHGLRFYYVQKNPFERERSTKLPLSLEKVIDPIHVLAVRAKGGTKGAADAFNTLESKLNSRGKFFGIDWVNAAGLRIGLVPISNNEISSTGAACAHQWKFCILLQTYLFTCEYITILIFSGSILLFFN